MDTTPTDLRRGDSIADRRHHSGWLKGLLLLASFGFSAAMFLTLDFLHSRPILRARLSEARQPSCGVRDPIRHHALKPNCAALGHWGENTYEVRTNSLGMRDEKIREVPLVDERPRILMLGDSFTQGMLEWRDSYVGRLAAHFSQYDILNGGVPSYSPSNYFNTTRILLAHGVEIDEVIVFIDLSDVADEAHVYQDADAFGAVRVPEESTAPPWRPSFSERFLVTNTLVGFFKRILVGLGFYHFATGQLGNPLDAGRGTWTYKSDTEIEQAGITSYAPLGVEGGIAKEKVKMTLLWQELKSRNIPISVVVYPWPAQVVRETAESRQVRIWREWCEGRCKRFISLFPAFLAVKDQCPRIQPGCWYLRCFTFGDIHYNANGNAVVANAVIKSLEELPPVKRQVTRGGP